MNILLTGGTGFIGSYIALELASNGHFVTILARNKNKVPVLKKIKEIEIIEGSITNKKLLADLVNGKDACIHVALNYTKQTGWEVLEDDTLPAVYIAGMAAQADVRSFIYTSSTAVNDNVYMIEENKLNGLIKTVHTYDKPHPTTFYGATKTASEIFLLAQSYQSDMRINIIRPGYTFGNPVVDGANTQGDTRFRNIVRNALHNEPIKVIKNDGTQFIWAGDLAKLYLKVLKSAVNRKTYFGLSKNFIPWTLVAEETIRQCSSKSKIEVEDRGWSNDITTFDVSDMKNDFGLEFDPWEKIVEHISYYIELEKDRN